MSVVTMETSKFIEPITGILIGVALIPVVSDYVNTANVTGSVRTLVLLIPFFYAIAVVVYVFKTINV
jgi:hypothetical protein